MHCKSQSPELTDLGSVPLTVASGKTFLTPQPSKSESECKTHFWALSHHSSLPKWSFQFRTDTQEFISLSTTVWLRFLTVNKQCSKSDCPQKKLLSREVLALRLVQHMKGISSTYLRALPIIGNMASPVSDYCFLSMDQNTVLENSEA